MKTKQILLAIATLGTFATASQAADVASILGRGAPTGGVVTERILVTGTPVDKVLGRAGNVTGNKLTAKFAVDNGNKGALNTKLLQRHGRA